MPRFRTFGGGGLARYLGELRPRFIVVRIDARGLRLRWAVPAWALEEAIRFAIRMAPIARRLSPTVARYLPPRWRERATRLDRSMRPRAEGRPLGRAGALRAVDALFSEEHRDILVLPKGEPLVELESGTVRIAVHTG